MTFFILLAREYLESGVFRETKAELAGHLTGLDREILTLCREKERLADLSEKETGRCYELLIRWCSGLLRKGVCDEKSDDRADGADCSAL